MRGCPVLFFEEWGREAKKESEMDSNQISTRVNYLASIYLRRCKDKRI